MFVVCGSVCCRHTCRHGRISSVILDFHRLVSGVKLMNQTQIGLEPNKTNLLFNLLFLKLPILLELHSILFPPVKPCRH